jgi:hypothetical protein
MSALSLEADKVKRHTLFNDYVSKICFFLFLLVLFLVFIATLDCYMDDAFIGYTYIKNFFSGKGFVFNPGERVEGVTNSGWLLFLIPFTFFGNIPFISKIISFLCVAATYPLLISGFQKYSCAYEEIQNNRDYDNSGYDIINNNNNNPVNNEPVIKKSFFPVLFTLFFLVNFDYFFFSLSGMETAFAGLLISLMLFLTSRKKYSAAGAVSGFLFFVRPDTVLIMPFFLFFSGIFYLYKSHRAPLKQKIQGLFLSGLSFFLVLAAGTGIRLVYFNQYLPNTFIAKSTSIYQFAGRLGLFFIDPIKIKNISILFASKIIILLLMSGIFFLTLKNSRLGFLSGSIIMVSYIFSVYARTDWTETGRYFAHYIPVASAILALSSEVLIRLAAQLVSHAFFSSGKSVFFEEFNNDKEFNNKGFDNNKQFDNIEKFDEKSVCANNLAEKDSTDKDSIEKDSTEKDNIEKDSNDKIRITKKNEKIIFSAVFISFLMAGIFNYSIWISKIRENSYPFYVMTSKKLFEPCKWICKNLPQNSTIATKRIGLISFITQCRIFDFKFGLTNKKVAGVLKEKEISSIDFPWKKEIKEIWQRENPDYYIEDSHELVKEFLAINKKNQDNADINDTFDLKKLEFNIWGVRYSYMKSFGISESIKWVILKQEN